jgi:purine-binding chemotaxis protein CheW
MADAALEIKGMTEDLSSSETIKLLVFRLADEEYATEITQTREIIKHSEITKIPTAPAFIKGILNLRGQIVVILDLRERFRLPAEESEHIIIADVGKSSFGIIVDKVTEIIKIEKDDIKDAPRIISSKIHMDYIKGVAVLGERILIILDLQKILNEEELLKVIEAENTVKKELPIEKTKKKEISKEEMKKILEKKLEK